MQGQVSFKDKVRQTVIQCASDYKSVFVDFEYLVCSTAFTINPYYIISGKEDNYRHLTGVSFPDPQVFYDKCINRTLTESDISFVKKGQTESAVKGSVRRKISVLPKIMHMFGETLFVEESFQKNRVKCSFAADDITYTLGFSLASEKLISRPMTLLKGFELDNAKAKKVDIILRRPFGQAKFDKILIGDKASLEKYKVDIWELLSDELFCVV